MRCFQSHEFADCHFLPPTCANKNSHQVWGIELFPVVVYKSQNSFILVSGWMNLAYLKVLGRVQSPGWCWWIILKNPFPAECRALVIFLCTDSCAQLLLSLPRNTSLSALCWFCALRVEPRHSGSCVCLTSHPPRGRCNRFAKDLSAKQGSRSSLVTSSPFSGCGLSSIWQFAARVLFDCSWQILRKVNVNFWRSCQSWRQCLWKWMRGAENCFLCYILLRLFPLCSSLELHIFVEATKFLSFFWSIDATTLSFLRSVCLPVAQR